MGVKEKIERMPIINFNAAGVDVGGSFHYVAIGQRKEDVKKYGVYTTELHAMAQWLKSEGITTVAMESTGDYWRSLYIILQDYGLEVILVNGKYTKNVKGKKTDIQDCQWIQKLHSMGLLEGSFLPDNFTESIRQVSRHRKNLIENASIYITSMQKALRQMNLRLDNVLRDVTGQSGQLIIKAILSGERNAEILASLANYKVHASKAEIAQALTGDWRHEFLIELKHSFELYHIFQSKIEECDKEIERLLQQEIEKRNGKRQLKALKKSYDSYGRKKVNKNDPKIDLDRYSYELSGGIDLMQVPAMGRSTLLALMSEVGFDLSSFPSPKQFASWLGLSPNNKISGGKILSSHTGKRKNRLSEALLRAANVIGNMKDNPLAEFFHRIAYKKGRMVAITATARKLSNIIWYMLQRKEAYNYMPNEEYKEKIRLQKLKTIQRQIVNLGIKQEEIVFVTA